MLPRIFNAIPRSMWGSVMTATVVAVSGDWLEHGPLVFSRLDEPFGCCRRRFDSVTRVRTLAAWRRFGFRSVQGNRCY